ncbi:MAG: hypothetical protein C0483_22730 [Pirellula sp.]|nr:hypothetical protein [Pirellula sp.]
MPQVLVLALERELSVGVEFFVPALLGSVAMFMRETRRSCGLALGFLLTWQGAEARADEPLPLPASPEGDAKVEALESAPLTPQLAKVAGPTERVVERYTNRLVKVERHVAQDAQGNFFNHGPWAKWSEEGRLMGQGEFRNGAQHGRWVRLYDAVETQEAFEAALELGFEAPFSSVAEFENGHLHGTWVILDAKKRQVSATEFDNGERHGKSLAWHPNGKKFREIEYRAGELDGAAVEFDAEERVVKQEKFVNGYRHGIKTEHYPTGEVKSECETLFAKNVVISEDDWWNGTSNVEIVGLVGEDQRHGRFTAWNLDGLKVLEGTYVDDRPEGRFTWWHENGTKAIEGQYVDGKQNGVWTWWYSNGMKELTGDYVAGEEAGNWKEWQETGLVATSMTVFETPLYEASDAVDLQPVEIPDVESNRQDPSVVPAFESKQDATTSIVEPAAATVAQAATATDALPAEHKSAEQKIPAELAVGETSAMRALFRTDEPNMQLEATPATADAEPVELQMHSQDLPRPMTPSIRPASFRRVL